MKIVGVIPARYSSSRLPGKPLADICGKPMLWWTYQSFMKANICECIYVATDNIEICNMCEKYSIPYVLTQVNHSTHLNRIYEVSRIIDSDLYVVVCGDEPLIESENIVKVLPPEYKNDDFIVRALMRNFSTPTEVIDPNNIKIVTRDDGSALFLSRSAVPYPFKTVGYNFKKIIGVECYSKNALDFYNSTEKGPVETIEDIVLLRFIEYHKQIYFTLVESISLSVDTNSDLEKIKKIIGKRNE